MLDGRGGVAADFARGGAEAGPEGQGHQESLPQQEVLLRTQLPGRQGGAGQGEDTITAAVIDQWEQDKVRTPSLSDDRSIGAGQSEDTITAAVR